MNDKFIINVADVIGSDLCITPEDGQKIYDIIISILEEPKQIEISFERIQMLTSIFLNRAIGQLYKDHKDDELKKIIYVGLSQDDQDVVFRVIENAKRYYSSPQKYEAAWNKEDGHDEE